MATFDRENNSDSDDDMFGGISKLDLKDAVDDEENEESEEMDQSRLILEAPFARIFRNQAQADEYEEEQDKIVENEANDEDAQDSANRDLSILVDWVTSCGGYVHPNLCMAPFPDSGVGGCFKGDNLNNSLKEGELVIRVPAKCILFSDDASIEGLKIIPSSLADIDLKQMVLALALIKEMDKGDTSEFDAYIKTLPKSLRSFPIMWAPEELDLLKLVSLKGHSQVVSQAKALRAEYDHIKACFNRKTTHSGLTFSEYMNAKLLVCSRCFGIGAHGDVALLPMIDMLNHSINPHVVLGRHETIAQDDDTEPTSTSLIETNSTSDNSFELRLLRSCQENEEVFSTYDKQGNRSPISWLLNYGFVPNDEKNSDKCCYMNEKRVSMIDALKQCGPHTHGAVKLVELADN